MSKKITAKDFVKITVVSRFFGLEKTTISRTRLGSKEKEINELYEKVQEWMDKYGKNDKCECGNTIDPFYKPYCSAKCWFELNNINELKEQYEK